MGKFIKSAWKNVTDRKRRYFVWALVLLALFCAISLGLARYNRNLNIDLDQMACDTISNQMEQQRYHLQSKMQGDMRVVEDLARIVCYVEQTPQELNLLISELIMGTSFENVAVVAKDGKGVLNNGAFLDVSEQPYFARASNGETSIAMPVTSVLQEDKILVTIASPIFGDDIEDRVLIGAYALCDLQSFILPAYHGESKAYVVDKSGKILLGPSELEQEVVGQNLFAMLQTADVLEYDTTAQMFNNLRSSQAGHSVLVYDGVEQVLHYMPLGVEEWNLVMTVPKAAVTRQAQSILRRAALLNISTLALLGMFLGYILWMQRKASREKAAYLHQLETMAYYDTLTGLPNLYGFKRQMKQMLKENPRIQFAVTKFDVDNFKAVNQMFGFALGDQVIVAMRDALIQVQNERDLQYVLCARTNADEFLVLEPCTENVREVSHRIRHFERAFRECASALLHDYKIEMRYGRCYLALGENDVEGALEKANLAHHSAKASGNKKLCEYDEVMKQNLLDQLAIEHKMDDALKNGAFKVFLQPKYILRTEKMMGAEALVRWKQDDDSYLSPNDFIPLFERNGFVVQLDLYMFEQVCSILRQWIVQGRPLVPISVNFSRLHLNNDGFVQQLERIADEYKVPRRFLEIELTESVFFQNQETLQELLVSLHSAGFLLSMDDFGTGYSSLGLLKDLPVDIIKIDRSFFGESASKKRAKLVIESVMHMAKKLGMHTVAEGVETKEHIDFLRQVGCDMVQGFYYARPMAAEDFYTYDDDKKKADAIKKG